MARTSFGQWKLVRNRSSSSHRAPFFLLNLTNSCTGLSNNSEIKISLLQSYSDTLIQKFVQDFFASQLFRYTRTEICSRLLYFTVSPVYSYRSLFKHRYFTGILLLSYRSLFKHRYFVVVRINSYRNVFTVSRLHLERPSVLLVVYSAWFQQKCFLIYFS